MKLIGVDRYRNEEIVNSVVSAGAIETVVNAYKQPVERNQKTIKVTFKIHHKKKL